MQTTFPVFSYTNQKQESYSTSCNYLFLHVYVNDVIYSPNGNISYACYHQECFVF